MQNSSDIQAMSYYESVTAINVDSSGPIEMTIKATETTHNGLRLRRILPAANRAAIGPFLLLDHFGPTASASGSVIDFPAPAFAGSAKLTYLFDGEVILSGSVANEAPQTLDGIHAWIALPAEVVIDELALEQQKAGDLPKLKLEEVTIRVVAGEIYGQASPVQSCSHALFLVCDLPEAGEFKLPGNYQEVATYVVSGSVEIGGLAYVEGSMAVAARGWPVSIRATLSSCIVVIGGMTTTLPALRTDSVTSSAIESAQSEN